MTVHPKARDMLLHAIDNGWSAALIHGTDTGGSPWVSVEAKSGRNDVRVTWHTRDTGTYRLFSAMVRTETRNWRDVTLTAALLALDVHAPQASGVTAE